MEGDPSKEGKTDLAADNKKNERLDGAMDQIRSRLGIGAIGRASLIRRPVKPRPEDTSRGESHPRDADITRKRSPPGEEE